MFLANKIIYFRGVTWRNERHPVTLSAEPWVEAIVRVLLPADLDALDARRVLVRDYRGISSPGKTGTGGARRVSPAGVVPSAP
jgi:hypothetical protein